MAHQLHGLRWLALAPVDTRELIGCLRRILDALCSAPHPCGHSIENPDQRVTQGFRLYPAAVPGDKHTPLVKPALPTAQLLHEHQLIDLRRRIPARGAPRSLRMPLIDTAEQPLFSQPLGLASSRRSTTSSSRRK